MSKQVVRVLGLTANKGEFEGVAYDYTRAYVERAMEQNENSIGHQQVIYNFGDSSVIHKYKGVPFPCMCEVEIVNFAKSGKDVNKIVSLMPTKG